MDLISLRRFCLIMTFVVSHKSVYLNFGDFKNRSVEDVAYMTKVIPVTTQAHKPGNFFILRKIKSYVCI